MADGNGASQKVKSGGLIGAYIESRVTSQDLLDAIGQHHPVTLTDDRARRYALYALFGRGDEDTGLPLFGKAALEWIDGRTFYDDRWGADVIEDLKADFPEMKVRPWVPKKRSRLLERDGLSAELRAMREAEDRRALAETDRPVLAVSGTAYDHRAAGATRRRLQRAARATEAAAPSGTARYVLRRMNGRPSNVFTRYVAKRVAEAHGVVRTLDIGSGSGEHADPLRRHYHKTLRAIEGQPQPFYKPSRKRRTDRVFPANPSALSLPKRVRDVLLQDFTQVDLKSAHLFIATALWDAPVAHAFLRRPGYNVWNDLWRHFLLDQFGREWHHIAPEFKSACKEATYSVLYGMSEPHVRGQFTRSLGDVLAPVPLVVLNEDGRHSMHEYAARYLVKHPVIADLLEARDRELERIEQEGRAETATGIRAEVDADKDVGAASVLATVAQSYEQEVMAEILRYEEEHHAEPGKNDFRVVAWIHDGAAVRFTRRKRTHLDAMRERVARRSRELLGVALTLEEE